MKRFTALLLAVLLMLGCFTASVAEETPYTQVQFAPTLAGDLQDELGLASSADWMKQDFTIALIAVLLPMDILNDDVTDLDLLEYEAKDAYVGENADGNMIILYPSTERNNALIIVYSPVYKVALFSVTELSSAPTQGVLQTSMENSCTNFSKVDEETAYKVIETILSSMEK